MGTRYDLSLDVGKVQNIEKFKVDIPNGFGRKITDYSFFLISVCFYLRVEKR